MMVSIFSPEPLKPLADIRFRNDWKYYIFTLMEMISDDEFERFAVSLEDVDTLCRNVEGGCGADRVCYPAA